MPPPPVPPPHRDPVVVDLLQGMAAAIQAVTEASAQQARQQSELQRAMLTMAEDRSHASEVRGRLLSTIAEGRRTT